MGLIVGGVSAGRSRSSIGQRSSRFQEIKATTRLFKRTPIRIIKRKALRLSGDYVISDRAFQLPLPPYGVRKDYLYQGRLLIRPTYDVELRHGFYPKRGPNFTLLFWF